MQSTASRELLTSGGDSEYEMSSSSGQTATASAGADRITVHDDQHPIIYSTSCLSLDKLDRIKRGYSTFVAALFVGGENTGCGLLALPFAMLGTGWPGVALIAICALGAGYAGCQLATCWLILERRWPSEYGGKFREPYAAIGYRALGRRMQ